MPTRHRWQFAIALTVLLLIATTVGFYSYAKHRANSVLRELPGKLAANIAQKAVGFTYSKSERGHTLFTIKASELTQFKDGIHAELHNVSILVYGREGDRYDQIYGDKFSYDQKAQEVRADGPVSIDLQANPHTSASQSKDQAAPEEVRNPIHLKTSGLVFSQATGIAHTSEKIEFRSPQGEGTAVGATYDTHNGTVRFEHDVNLTALSDKQSQTLTASSAVFSQSADKQKLAKLEDVTIRDSDREIKARILNVYLRPNSTLDRITAEGGVESRALTGAQNSISATTATALAGVNNQINHAELHGNVHLETQNASANSAAAILHFDRNASLKAADLTGGATVRQPNGSKLQSQSLHLDLRPDRSLAAANTIARATVTLIEAAAHRNTTISANSMNAVFDSASRIESLHAAPDAKVVSTDPKTQRTSSSESLDALFTNSPKTALARITESGNVRITEGDRTATASHAEYNPTTQLSTLTGSPRLTDNSASISAQRIQIDSAGGQATAQDDVRLTYAATKSQTTAPGMFSGSSPLHAIATSAQLNKPDTVTLHGSPARLWQDANIIEAPLITFDRDNRTMTATGGPQIPVTTSFVQSNNSGKLVPVNVTARALHYSDESRRANFTGDVTVRGNGATITSQNLTVQLLPPNQQTKGQIDRITATGNVILDQESPARHGTGETLLYTAQDAKFLLTGTPNSSPSIFDAEHGSLTGDSLTFYTRDDRVLVESHGKRTITHTKISSTK